MARVGWTITFEGKAFCESDLTVADSIRALEVAGCTWVELHPLAGPAQFVALLATFLAAIGEDFDQAAARVSRLRMVDALDMVTAGEEAIVVQETPRATPRRDDGDPAGDRSRPLKPVPSMPSGAEAKVG
jgi:hypothetical protein